MKKGIILSSLFLFILASTAGKDYLFHIKAGTSENILSESETSPLGSNESRPFLCEDSEEMEGRIRALPILQIFTRSDFSIPVLRGMEIVPDHLNIQESYIEFSQALRAPPARIIELA